MAETQSQLCRIQIVQITTELVSLKIFRKVLEI